MILPSPPLGPGVEALPRLAGEGEVVERINGSLAMIDRSVAALLECEDIGRSVAVLFRGPDFVSFSDSTGYFCDGAAHPWWGTTYLTYDLTTGEVADPGDLLPPGIGDAALWALFIEHLDASVSTECRDLFGVYTRDPLGGHALWLSAEGQALGIAPVLAWVDVGCSTEVLVPADELARLGFPDRVVRALRQSGP